MKIIGLNGRVYSWNLVGHVPLGDDDVERSTLHLMARNILTKLYPLDRVLEEVPLPGSDGLTADFYLPSLKMMVEAHGPQHYKFTPFFHRTIDKFIHGQRNDRKKRDWCELNGITLVELPHGEVNEWERRIREAASGKS